MAIVIKMYAIKLKKKEFKNEHKENSKLAVVLNSLRQPKGQKGSDEFSVH